jgi:ATP-dependent RNA helicase DDX3X
VINLDLPADVDSYIHRIGRTGRAGKKGIATSLWNESNAAFLTQLCQHFRDNRQPIPEELEDFARDQVGSRGYARGGPPRRGGRGGRGGMSRDKSWGHLSYRY